MTTEEGNAPMLSVKKRMLSACKANLALERRRLKLYKRRASQNDMLIRADVRRDSRTLRNGLPLKWSLKPIFLDLAIDGGFANPQYPGGGNLVSVGFL